MDKKISVAGIIVWLITVIFYLYEFILQVSPGVLLKPLMSEFSLSAAQASQIGAVYFYTYALMQIPVGIFLDRFGPRKVLSIAVILCTVGSFLMAFAPSFNFILLARLLTALGSAAAMVGSMKIVSNWFDKQHFPVFSGLILLAGMLGAIFATAPLAYSVEHYGWKETILFLGIAGAFITLLILTIVRDKPTTYSNPTVSNEQNRFRWKDLLTMITSSNTLLAALYSGLMLSPALSLGTLWGEKYLSDSYSYTTIQSATAMSFIFIGLGVGGPLGGWLVKRWVEKKTLMTIASICSFILLLLYIYMPNNAQIFYYTLGFLLGVSTAFSWITYTFVKEMYPQKLHATAIAFVNLVTMLFGATAQLLVGLSLDIFFVKKMVGHQAVYLENQYDAVFTIFPVLVLIALCLTFFLKEGKNPKIPNA